MQERDTVKEERQVRRVEVDVVAEAVAAGAMVDSAVVREELMVMKMATTKGVR